MVHMPKLTKTVQRHGSPSRQGITSVLKKTPTFAGGNELLRPLSRCLGKELLTEPHCGFSKEMVEILNKHNIQFGSFDIFPDDEVSGPQNLSQLPTFLQLCVSGELIGGLDMIELRSCKYLTS